MADKGDVLVRGEADGQSTSDSTADGAAALKSEMKGSPMDSGEDFDMLDSVDDEDEDPPPLEDAGGGEKEMKREEGAREVDGKSSDVTDASPVLVEEWLDVLGNK